LSIQLQIGATLVNISILCNFNFSVLLQLNPNPTSAVLYIPAVCVRFITHDFALYSMYDLDDQRHN